jgi:hypothetical protein
LSRILVAIVGLMAGLAGPSVARGETFHFALVFGSQSHPKLLKYTHTWAVFVRAVGQGPDLSTYQLDAHTISWYPASMSVKVLRPWPETGVNLTLEQTLSAVYANGEFVTLWGPFLIGTRAYQRSLVVRDLLHSGRVQYRAISTARDLLIADCIHAVAAVDPLFGRDHYPLIRIGNPASRYIAREIMVRSVEQGIDQSRYDFSWLIPRLGLDRYPIQVVSPRELPTSRCGLCLLPP